MQTEMSLKANLYYKSFEMISLVGNAFLLPNSLPGFMHSPPVLPGDLLLLCCYDSPPPTFNYHPQTVEQVEQCE